MLKLKNIQSGKEYVVYQVKQKDQWSFTTNRDYLFVRMQQLGGDNFELHQFDSNSKNSYLIFDESQNKYVPIKYIYKELYLLRQDDLM